MDELRVPKRRLSVEVSFSADDNKHLALFLGEAAEHHGGPERPSDLLNGATAFLPMIDPDTGSMWLINCAAIAFMRVPIDAEIDEGDALETNETHSVRVTLKDGRKLEGYLRYVRPTDSSRLTDHLNEPPMFFRLLEPDRAVLVNKHQVRVVETR